MDTDLRQPQGFPALLVLTFFLADLYHLYFIISKLHISILINNQEDAINQNLSIITCGKVFIFSWDKLEIYPMQVRRETFKEKYLPANHLPFHHFTSFLLSQSIIFKCTGWTFIR